MEDLTLTPEQISKFSQEARLIATFWSDLARALEEKDAMTVASRAGVINPLSVSLLAQIRDELFKFVRQQKNKQLDPEKMFADLSEKLSGDGLR